MKTHSHRPTASLGPRTEAATPQSVLAQPAYGSASATRDLMSASVTTRDARMAASDMVSPDEAAKLIGQSADTICAWIDDGRCIGLRQANRSYRLPRWQFEPPLWTLLPQLAEALGTTEGCALLAFLETSHGALSGATPRAAIEQGQGERVLVIAAHGT